MSKQRQQQIPPFQMTMDQEKSLLVIDIYKSLFNKKDYLDKLRSFPKPRLVLYRLYKLPILPSFMSAQQSWFEYVQYCAVMTAVGNKVTKQVTKWIRKLPTSEASTCFFTFHSPLPVCTFLGMEPNTINLEFIQSPLVQTSKT